MFKLIPFEAAIWFTGLLWLAFLDPGGAHFSFCPVQNMGFDFCPGCGLGHSISLFFHGHFAESLAEHPFGIFAIIILSYRIVDLTKKNLQRYGKSN